MTKPSLTEINNKDNLHPKLSTNYAEDIKNLFYASRLLANQNYEIPKSSNCDVEKVKKIEFETEENIKKHLDLVKSAQNTLIKKPETTQKARKILDTISSVILSAIIKTKYNLIEQEDINDIISKITNPSLKEKLEQESAGYAIISLSSNQMESTKSSNNSFSTQPHETEQKNSNSDLQFTTLGKRPSSIFDIPEDIKKRYVGGNDGLLSKSLKER